MNVLVIGSGGREHAISKAIKSSPLLKNLYMYKPNSGFKSLGVELLAETQEELVKQAVERNINLVIVGPEQYLADGIADKFINSGIACIATTAEWAKLESSKAFAKDFMDKYSIHTADYCVVTDENQINSMLLGAKYPLVIKADGLAGGKGVSIVHTEDDAKTTISQYLQGKFGIASKKVLLEQYLYGDEISVMSLWDGSELLSFVPARDFKRLNSDVASPNTGGMGAFCPVVLDNSTNDELNLYLDTLKSALRDEQADFVGFIYSGLMLTNDGIKVLEYNMRLGDPETQVLLRHLESDFLELLVKASNRDLKNTKIKWKEGFSACVVLVSQGYPEKLLESKEEINFNKNELNCKNLNLFVANSVEENNKLFTNGGRVLNICSTSKSPFDDIYSQIKGIKFFPSQFYRDDLSL